MPKKSALETLVYMDKKQIYCWGLSLKKDEQDKEEKELLQILKELPKPLSGNFLEIGVGSGRFIEKVSRKFPKTKCFGVDVVPDFVKTKNPKIRLSLQSAEKLSFPDNFFSFVILIDVLHHVPNKEKAISEISRVCKPGGTIIFRDIRPRHALDKLRYRLVDLTCLVYNTNLPKYFSEKEWEPKLSQKNIRIKNIQRYNSQLDWIICQKSPKR